MKYTPNKWYQNVNFITVHHYPTLGINEQKAWSTIENVYNVQGYCCVGVFKIKYKK